jgi:uncharacterized protein (TIGR00730 family)
LPKVRRLRESRGAMEPIRRVCIFCGSSYGSDPRFAAAAKDFAELLARAGVGVVYGGARVGLMGVIADAALAAGGEVIGVLPRALQDKEIAHVGLTQLHVVGSMHERKALMADLADAFVALPGGYGTLDEFCEVLTWAQLGIHRKPCGLLNVAGYYDAFLAQVDTAVRGGLTRPEHRALILSDAEPTGLLQQMREFQPKSVSKWVNPDVR